LGDSSSNSGALRMLVCTGSVLTARIFSHPGSQEVCAVQGGTPVVYTSSQQQLLVEGMLTLPAVYWIGVTRDNDTMPYTTVTGASVSPNTSNSGPYAHW
jgi:hypothetical protein